MSASSRDLPFPSVETVSPGDVISNDGGNLDNSPSGPSTPSVGTMTPAASTPEAGRVLLSSTEGESNSAAHELQGRPAQANGLENGFDNMHLSPGPDTSRESLSPRRNRRQRSSSHMTAPIHEVRNEERPENAFHRPEFQEALTDAKSLMARVASTLAASVIHSDIQSTLHRLCNEAIRLAEYRCAPVRRVGCVGDSGAGKSSLLNSLLDTKGLARTSGSGEACTCVVTEYHHHPQNSLDIDVELFSENELREQIRSLLQSYRRYHLDEDAMDEAERQDFRPKAELARSTFDAMFRGHLHDEDVLLAGHEDDVLETLMSWAIDSRIFRVRQRHIGLSVEDCSARLRHLSSDSGSRDEPAHWPFIKIIKVFLNAHVLSTGLILVDLPGLRDLNSARRLITERYMLRCQEIFVVCNISRAVTDEGVHDVFDLANNAGLSNIGIVCTRSEDIQAEEAIRDPGWRGERTVRIRQIMAAIETASTALARNEEEQKFYNDLDDDDRFPEEIDEERRLLRQNRQLKNELTNLKHQLKRYLITNRNAFVTQALRDLYTDRVGPSDALQVFCVSNKDYWAVRELPAETARPRLELSGIIAARRHCLSLVAESQLRGARSYLRDEIPIVLSQIDLWVEAGARNSSEERRGEMQQVLGEVERALRSQLLAPTTDVNRVATNLKQLFMNVIYARRNAASWSQCAGQATSEWSTWYHPTYAAFCRNDGDFATPKVGRRDWNAEAIASMVDDLGGPWDELTVSLQQVQQDVLVVVEEVIENSARLLHDTLEVSPGAHVLEHLVQALDAQGRMLVTSLENNFNLLESNLSLLRISVMSSIRSSMIRQVMATAYSSAKQEYGGGSDRRRKRIIGDAFSEQEVFQTIMRDFKSFFLIHTEDLQESIRASVSAYFDAISEDLDLVRMESVAVESERDPAFRDLVASRLRECWGQLRLIQVVAGGST